MPKAYLATDQVSAMSRDMPVSDLMKDHMPIEGEKSPEIDQLAPECEHEIAGRALRLHVVIVAVPHRHPGSPVLCAE
jgi:hypothetical protein